MRAPYVVHSLLKYTSSWKVLILELELMKWEVNWGSIGLRKYTSSWKVLILELELRKWELNWGSIGVL